jgi:hypothetical protein
MTSHQYRGYVADSYGVIAGLDPAIHRLRNNLFAKRMDARVKPGNDSQIA